MTKFNQERDKLMSELITKFPGLLMVAGKGVIMVSCDKWKTVCVFRDLDGEVCEASYVDARGHADADVFTFPEMVSSAIQFIDFVVYSKSSGGGTC